MNVKHVAKDLKKIENTKGVRCKLGQNKPKKIKDINDKGMKRKSKVNMKEFLVHSQAAQRTRCYPII